MGILQYLFDNEWSQRSDINETREAVDRAHDAQDATDRYVHALDEDVGVLALYVRTLSRLLVEKGVMTKDELLAAMKVVDLQDGKDDGKYEGPMNAP